ncbi:MAG TPA: hypothetical protein VGK73_31650 [Polyangiaceae bacterium]
MAWNTATTEKAIADATELMLGGDGLRVFGVWPVSGGFVISGEYRETGMQALVPFMLVERAQRGEPLPMLERIDYDFRLMMRDADRRSEKLHSELHTPGNEAVSLEKKA